MDKIKNYWKLITAGAGAILLIWNTFSPAFGFLPASWAHPIAVVVGILTLIATHQVPGPNYTAGAGRHEAPGMSN